jgi:hypothetical protein
VWLSLFIPFHKKAGHKSNVPAVDVLVFCLKAKWLSAQWRPAFVKGLIPEPATIDLPVLDFNQPNPAFVLVNQQKNEGPPPKGEIF